jgi:hypothetical protein
MPPDQTEDFTAVVVEVLPAGPDGEASAAPVAALG